MHLGLVTGLLGLSAALSFALGCVVVFRNSSKRTHRLFAMLSANLFLWAIGVLMIVTSRDENAARFWIKTTFVVASFLPATFYHFIVYFPHQRFDGFRSILLALYAGGLVQVAGTLFTPWYLHSVAIQPGLPPLVTYGPIFYGYSFWVLLSMLFSFSNLIGKRGRATGVERRQVEHVLIGIFLCTTFATVTNVVAPAMDVTSTEMYGPVFTVVMMGLLAYAMVRYHLMDIWLLVSQTTIYVILTAFVIVTFLGTISLVHWVFSRRAHPGDLFTTLLAAVVIVLVLQPLKERLQLLVERTVLKRRYDVGRFCAHITRHATQFMRLDEVFTVIAKDIRDTIGVDNVRLWRVDDKDPCVLAQEFSTLPEERRVPTREHAALLDYIRVHSDPVVLKKLLHERPTERRMTIARHLAELDAYLCVPLRASSKLVGVLTLGEKTSGDIFSPDDLTVFVTIAGPLGTAIENAGLYLKLEEVNVHLARILSNMRGGVVAVDTEGKITTYNASAVEILGPLEEGQSVETLSHEVREVLLQTLKDARGVGDFETVIQRPTGERTPVVLSSSSLGVRGNENCGAMVMIHDLTQVKRLEQNVQRADRLSSIGTLAAGMAHEVKNPLVSIKTFSQLLLSRFDDLDFRRTFAEVVPQEVERIDGIVSRLLDIARPRPVQFAPQSLQRIIEKVLNLIESHIRKWDIRVELSFPADEVMIYGDEQQLHQVFLNLFLNAIDALRDTQGGTLSVRLYLDRGWLRGKRVAPFMETDCVRVVVSDTGSGIPPHHLEQLFTPFFTTKAEGCGLGLSVVHGIVTEHGGEIDVESVYGAGTAFTVTFPLMKTEVSFSGN